MEIRNFSVSEEKWPDVYGYLNADSNFRCDSKLYTTHYFEEGVVISKTIGDGNSREIITIDLPRRMNETLEKMLL